MSFIRRHIPITDWLGSYRASWLLGDLLAGITVWALLIPEALAYAGIAGVPPQYGLYAAPLALIGYAVFGSSRNLFVGPSSTVALISAASVAPLAADNPDLFIAMTVCMALLAGAAFIVAGVARLGFLARFLAKPVLTGFIIGLAFNIAVGQTGKIIGIHVSGETTADQLIDVLKNIGGISWFTVAIGITCLFILFFISKYLKTLPAALIVAATAILAAWVFNLGSHGINLVGEIPSGLPDWKLSGLSFENIYHLIPGALAVMLIGFAEAIAVAKTYAAKHDYVIDVNQELIAYGIANIGAGLMQGFAVTGSLSKTAASDEAGGRTPMVLLFCAALSFLTFMFLTAPFEYMPEAALGAIVIHALWSLFDFKSLMRYKRSKTIDFLLAVFAAAGVIFIGVMAGIVIGVALSLVAFIDRASKPHSAILGISPSQDSFGDIEENPDYSQIPGVLIYRFDAPFVFTNSEQMGSEIRKIIRESVSATHFLIIDCEMMYDMDTTASDQLRELKTYLENEGICLLLARVHGPVRDFMLKDGVLDFIGDDCFFKTVLEAAEHAESIIEESRKRD